MEFQDRISRVSKLSNHIVKSKFQQRVPSSSSKRSKSTCEHLRERKIRIGKFAGPRPDRQYRKTDRAPIKDCRFLLSSL